MHPGIRMLGPISYLLFLWLVARSRMVLTNSGCIQEETTVSGVLCLTMRPNTRRPITCEVGTNVLAGTDPQRIIEQANLVLNGFPARFPRSGTATPLNRFWASY